MKITIDTKEDNFNDIHKVVKMLQAWLESHTGEPVSMSSPTDMFSDAGRSSESGSSEASGSIFSMFNDSGSTSKPSESSIEKKEIQSYDDDIPQVIPYH